MNSIEKLHQKNTKINNLFNKIKKINILNDLLFDDTFDKHTHLHKCVMLTKQYPILNKYIDEYLNIYPNDIDLTDRFQLTPLMLAVAKTSTISSEETVKILLKHNANVNVKNEGYMTPLMFASVYSNSGSTTETVRLLLESGANVNAQDNDGYTSLTHSVLCTRTRSSEKTVRLLLEYGADINIQDIYGWTPIMYAAGYSETNSTNKTVNILLEYSPNLNIQDRNGTNVFALSVMNFPNDSSEETIIKLLKTCNDISTLIDIAFNVYESKNGKKALDIILPNRRKFISEVTLNKEKLFESEFWRFNNCDFKIMPPKLINFESIVAMM